LIEQALAAGRSVVVDNTNATPELRAPLIALGQQHGATVTGYYFAAEVAGCLARNRAREGRARVPDVAIYATRKILAPPTPAEGFDALYAVRLEADGGFVVAAWDAASPI
jgi:predicted kinase